MKNKHLTLIQRNQIQVLLQTKTPINKIAELLDTDKSTIYREVKRNKKRFYYAIYAQQLSTERKERFGRKRKFTSEMKKSIIEKMIKEQWSPKQIVGFSRINNIPMVSHESIYQLIRQDKKDGGLLWTHTRHSLKHRKRPIGGGKQVNIKNKVFIDLRPSIVDTQERCGDWEIDTIVGENNKGAILTLTERKTGFLLMEKMTFGKQAEGLAKAAIRLLFAFRNNVHTITSDNGSEFAQHELIAKKLKANFYFAHPYSSWERGLNEYTNKLIRQYVIKGTNFDLYSSEFIRLVQNKINRRPREKLNFQTPSKIFYASLI